MLTLRKIGNFRESDKIFKIFYDNLADFPRNIQNIMIMLSGGSTMEFLFPTLGDFSS